MRTTKRIAKTFCTTREAADLLGISVRTAQLWCEAGLLDAWKTVGGHRRIMRGSIERLLRIADVVVPGEGRWLPPSKRSFLPPNAGWQRVHAPAGFHILVVEDDEDLRRLYALRLKRWAIRPTVDTVGSSYEALARLAKKRPDMMIIDLNMPGLNGFHLLRCLNEPETPTTMIAVVVSGLPSGEIERQGGVPGGVPIFSKPVPFKELAAIAEGAVASRGAMAECKLK